ncbi:MAG: hypothetical protein GXY32_07785 [Ruminococcaceae bacterium]|nr:hypothetical protein [Oscillospiraceae bacterium]
MADKDKMVDFPEYDPNARVPWPPKPGSESPFGKKPVRKEEEKPEKKPYYETYDPDPPTADPSQTKPGAPDIRDPDTRLPEGTDLGELSPDIEHKL